MNHERPKKQGDQPSTIKEQNYQSSILINDQAIQGQFDWDEDAIFEECI